MFAAMLVGQSRAAVLLKEILVNPPSTDGNNEYVEIVSTNPSDSLSNVWLLEIEGDSTSGRGTVDNARNLTGLSFGTNGLLVLGEGYSTSNPWGMTNPPTGLANLNRPGAATIENGGVSMLLVTSFTGSQGTDYDANNDGVFDATPWTSVLDSIAWKDSSAAAAYGPELVRPGGGAPDALSRIYGNTTANDASAWWGGSILDTYTNPDPDLSKDYKTDNAANWVNRSFDEITPGTANVPESGAFTLLAIDVLSFCGIHWKKRD